MVKKEERQSYFRDVSAKIDSEKLERDILAFWEREKIFERSLTQNKDKPQFTFYDGPPYATGKPHYGHILQSTIKDTILRYKTMRGYFAPRRVGWDCHGLPVEVLVEKELGISTKRDIERDIAHFNQQCRATVTRYVQEFTDTLKRMGRWADYDNAYFTLNREYMETEWWIFKRLWDLDLVYKAFRSTPYCIRCATPLSNFEVSINYKDTTDTAVYVLLKVRAQDNLFLLIWTTTPWTLPGNIAVAAGPELNYVTIEHEGKNIIVAQERLAAVFGDSAAVIKQWTRDELTSLRYEPLYPDFSDVFAEVLGEQKNRGKLFRLVLSDHVSGEDGTGLVHITPAFGEEDLRVAQQRDLPVWLRPVDRDGRFEKDAPRWAGENIFETNKEIVADLDEGGLLFKQEQYTHSYPFCWRCETPLIYYALDTWFVRIQKIKDRMLAINEQITWIPEHVKHGRFGKGIESAPDWAVSRNRFWSVPMPIWECDTCDHRVCVGSVAELVELSGTGDIPDLHRPFVDQITWRHECSQASSGTMKRIPEVLDVWFDAGSMPYAQWHYPFENKELMERLFPADFIVEAIEQTRLWFYVLHVLAVALTTENAQLSLGADRPAFKNAIGAGLIFAEDGRKLSKKLKNYPEPEPTIQKHGADALRLYLLSSSTLGEPYRFSERDLQQLYRNVYVRFWNVYSFFVRYANMHGWSPATATSQNVLDHWIHARLKQLELEVIQAADSYHIDIAARLFVSFIDDLSNWYVRRSRVRFQALASKEKRQEALGTLFEVLVRTTKLLAPFMPFVAEEMYRNLTGEDSVHLQQLEESRKLSSDEQALLRHMASARATVSSGLSDRAFAKIKVRQPISELFVQGEALPDEFEAIVREEANVKKVTLTNPLPPSSQYIVSGGRTTAIATPITPALEAEGIAREIIHHGQMLRRKAGYALNDRITLVVSTDSARLREVLEQQRDLIMAALQADIVVEQSEHEDTKAELVLLKDKLYLGVAKRA